jgi:predicted nucleotidyltransferase
MTSPANLKHILTEYRKRLSEILGNDSDSVLLYGSQARGEASTGSDVDVLCIISQSSSREPPRLPKASFYFF